MNQWTKMFERFAEWGAPLRPTPEDVSLFSRALQPKDRTLLLGVTAELMDMVDLAVDHNPGVIEKAQNSRAVLGHWGDLPYSGEFDAVIGDGALNAFEGPQDQFFAQMKKVLKPGGRLILRVYISPEKKDNLEEVLKSKSPNFHAFKWRVAHAVANPYVRVQDLFDIIKPVYDHPTLEVYKGSPHIYYFPKLSELPLWESIDYPSSYELSERCPVITWRFH